MTYQNAITNLDQINKTIELSRTQYSAHHIVKLIGISKYHTTQEITTLYQAGQRAFGENKVQDLKTKQSELEDLPLEWHFVGTLQTNKINALIDCDPFLFHALDSLELAQELDKRLKIKNKTMRCLLQINSAQEESKSGVHPQDAINTYRQICTQFHNIQLVGVMSIGAHSDDFATVKQSFETTKTIFDSLKEDGASICSMGMSGDYPLAISLGSNMIRVGSALFQS